MIGTSRKSASSRRMKTHSYLINWAVGVVMSSLAACGGGGDGGTTAAPPTSGGVPLAPAEALVMVKVVDSSGLPLAGVTVQRRDTLEEVTTDATGQASSRFRSAAAPGWQLYRDGLVTQVQQSPLVSVRVASYSQSFVMLPREEAVVHPFGAGGTVTGKHGLALTLPASALMTPGGGSVDINLTSIDTASSNITALPSSTFLQQPWDYNNEAILAYGAAELVVRQSGGIIANLIQPATLDIPLYATQHPDGRAIAVGERIAVATLDHSSLLHFNSEWHPLQGIGDGEVIAAAGSPTGLALRVTLPPSDGASGPLPLNAHVSAIALPGSRSIEVNITPPAGETLPAQSPFRLWGNVTSRGAPQAAFDYGGALPFEIGASGVLRSLYLARSVAFEVRVEVTVGAATYFGTTQIAAATPDMSSAQVALARVAGLLPFITYPNGNASAKIGTMVPFKVEFAGPQPDRVELYADQTLIGEVSGQRAFYTFIWNTAGLSPATRRLYAVAHGGTSSARSGDVEVALVN